MRSGAAARTTIQVRSHILLITQDAEIRRSVWEALAKQSRITFASEGQGGLRRALKLLPDLLLIDMTTREETVQLVQQARRYSELENIPIVVICAVPDTDDKLKLLREGAQDYLMKPFALELLAARVHTWIEIKHTREILQSEFHSDSADLEGLARLAVDHAHQAQTAIASMRLAQEQTESAEHAHKMRSGLIGMISHELKTPVTGLQLQLERLQRGRESPLSARQREVVRRISLSSQRLADLIDSLQQYARIQTGRKTVKLESCDPGAIATAAVEDIRLQAEQKRLGLRVSIPHDLPALTTDPRLLRLILVNLLINAVKYTDHGFIELELDRAHDVHRLRVRDTGHGTAPEDRARVFEAFEQLEPTFKTHSPGVGLGLALVREMAASLGGDVRLESELGFGSTFTVTLPSPVDQENLAGLS